MELSRGVIICMFQTELKKKNSHFSSGPTISLVYTLGYVYILLLSFYAFLGPVSVMLFWLILVLPDPSLS